MSRDETGVAGTKLRVGFVAADPLRQAGLEAILEEWRGADGRPLATLVGVTLQGILDDGGLTVMMIDAGCTDHLFALLETIRRARPGLRMIVLGESEDQSYMQRVIGAGAKGYLTHTARASEVRMALEIVSDGSVWAPRKVLARLLDSAAEASASEAEAVVRFTGREVEVLRFLVAGLGNREIAKEMKIDASTVKAHLSRLMRKVGATNRVELTMRAMRLGG